jgi:hypothetical protein
MRCFGLQALYPGHGRVSTTPIDDIDRAMANAHRLLEASTEGGPEVFYQKAGEN